MKASSDTTAHQGMLKQCLYPINQTLMDEAHVRGFLQIFQGHTIQTLTPQLIQANLLINNSLKLGFSHSHLC